MNNIEFDRRIKELVDSCQEPVAEDLWAGIEKGLDRRSSMIWVRRVSYAVVAASLVVGLILNLGSSEEMMRREMAVRVIQPERQDVNVGTFPLLAKLDVAQRPQVEEEVIVDKVDLSDEQPAVEEAVVPQVEEEKGDGVADKVVVRTTKEEYVRSVLSADEEWMYEEEKNSDRGVILGVSSNMLAFGGKGISNGSTQYMPGASMSVQNGITPITKPTFSIPVTFGLQVQFPVGERLAIGTGLNYTYLRNSFQALIDNSVQGLVDQKLHYIGLPVSLFVNILDDNNFVCYASAGGTMEKGLQVSSKIKDILDGVTHRKEGIKGLQWSVNIGVGLQYSFSDLVGIYFDPSLVYFFDTKQPFSVRTSQPLQFDMELGFRFNL